MELPRHAERGLASDLEVMLAMRTDRRRSLRWLLAGAASLPLAACGGAASDTDDIRMLVSVTSANTVPVMGACGAIPEESAGPYPADGSNSNGRSIVNALDLSGIVRSDIRTSIAGATGVAAGVPLTIRLQLLNASGDCAALDGYAVYLWHCDRDGAYSMYSPGLSKQNYLRGVQASDASGKLSFSTIFPGCYAGRMPHVHFEVYPDLELGLAASQRIKTSQFTFPMALLAQIYATPGYQDSAANLAHISYATDSAFNDGYALQLASVTGNAADGYVATLTLAVNG